MTLYVYYWVHHTGYSVWGISYLVYHIWYILLGIVYWVYHVGYNVLGISYWVHSETDNHLKESSKCAGTNGTNETSLGVGRRGRPNTFVEAAGGRLLDFIFVSVYVGFWDRVYN